MGPRLVSYDTLFLILLFAVLILFIYFVDVLEYQKGKGAL